MSGTAIGSPVTLSAGGTASTTFSESVANTYTLSATYNGDANYASATATESLIVTAIKTPVKVNLIPAASPASSCGVVSFSVQVSSTAGGSPMGTVELESGPALLASASLLNGAATISTSAPGVGTYSFVASYSGDSLHEPATSTPISLIGPPFGHSCTGGHPPSVGAAQDR